LTSQRHLFSSEAQDLTENDAEYVIKGIKHFFETVIVVQYEIQNTLEDQILSEVQVKISKLESAHGLKLKGIVPLHEEDQIKYNEKRFAYIILSKADGKYEFPHITISQKMTFKITEIDVDTEEELGSYDEEYENVFDLLLSTKDYISAQPIGKSFKESWEALGAQGQREDNLAEKSQTYQLPFKSMQLAVTGVINFFGGMSVCEQSQKVDVTQKVHNLFLSGLFYGQYQVYVRGQIGFN